MNTVGRKVAALHIAYIERDGVERDGSEGRLYGPAEGFDRDQLLEDLPSEKRQFRFIVSPEDAGELDLHAYTRALMVQMEADLGRRLIWGAVDHWNTDNPHTHVVVRGLDTAGKDLSIDPEYIKSGLRWRAQELATRELGLRSETDVVQQRVREVSQERLTSIDREIAPLVDAEGRLALKSVGRLGVPLPLYVARLQALESRTICRSKRNTGVDWQGRGRGRPMSVRGKRQVHPYLSPEILQRLKSYCAAKGVTDSAVVESALREYFADARDSALVMRRLDRNDRNAERLRREVGLLSELASSWIRVWYAHTPGLPASEKDAAQRSAASRHAQLLDHVAKRIDAGKSLATEIIVEAVADTKELAAAAESAGVDS